MPKNKVQFQKGLSLTQFLQDYGSEAQCEQALFAARWPDGLNCPRCGGARFCRLSTRRATFQCNHCKRQLSLLAGTVFQATKLPLSIWFLAIYFLSQTKSGISALELGRKLGVNDNTAWLLKHKLMQTMRERDQRYRVFWPKGSAFRRKGITVLAERGHRSGRKGSAFRRKRITSERSDAGGL